MARLLTLLTLASLETTLVSLPILALTSFDLPWPFLLLVVALGVAADTISLRLPPRMERTALAVGAALAVLLVLARQFGGPLAGLAAFLPGSNGLGLAYTLTLIALFLYWRGTRVATRDSLSVSAIFGRGAAVMVVALLIGPILGLGTPLGSAPAMAHIVGFISLGLLALALTHAEDDPASREKRLGWRWLISLVIAIVAVVLIGVLAVALLGGGATMEAAQNLLRLLIVPFALVGGLIAYLLITFLGEPLAYLLRAIFARISLLQNLMPQPEQVTSGGNDQGMFETVTRLADGATFLMALIPLVIIIAAILLLRRRSQRARAEDEERESLGVAASLASDLRDLLGRLRNPFARHLVGLQAALAALRDDDPATRVRRAYVRFLLRLEARDLTRAPAQTPAELAAAVEAPQAVAALTAAYERARYNPAGVALADAEGAERALDSLDDR
ncbi:DUF4129 domain-containing protein [Chloroflexales bacterium ZM16-3]|nr:DUF4129 domain-containing protein [Chloroflexales bacterium ZM16-3]